MTSTRNWKRWIGGTALTLAVVVAGKSVVGKHFVGRAAAELPGDDGPRISVSLSERALTVLESGEVVMSAPVAIGKTSKPTPTGSFSIRRIVWNPKWIPPDQPWAAGKKPQEPGARANPMKVVKMFFKEPDYYIHGTGDIESLGDAASHGCLRMDPDDAYRVARYVMEHGGQPRDESWFARILNFRSETKTVYLDHPIPITISD